MDEQVTLDNIDELIDYWVKECDDVDPRNCDSMDIGVDIHDVVARKAICSMPILLRRLKDYMSQKSDEGS